MSQAISSVQAPCLGTSEAYYSGRRESSPLFDTKAKVILIVSLFFAIAGLGLLHFLPLAGGICLIVGGLGSLSVSLVNLVKSIRELCVPDSDLEKVENLEAAKQLAGDIAISPELQQELQAIIPTIDAIGKDARIASRQYNCDKTATFTLKTAPDLQFRISSAEPRSRLGCNEFYLAGRYENAVYAQAICDAENYDSLFVPPIKPIHLKVGGLRRSLLVEKTVQRAEPTEHLEQAVRQMVRFLLKTGGTGASDPLPFIPVKGNKLALQNLHHLTEEPHSEASTREFLEICLIIDEEHSLLSSLDREDLIDIALDELRKLRPTYSGVAQGDVKRATEARNEQIRRAKEKRMSQIEKRMSEIPSAPQVNAQPTPQVNAQPERVAPRNILGISPEDLGFNLTLTDYAVIKRDGVFSDGVCRIITLGEVAQAVIDRINQRLEKDPQNPNITFTSEEMLIGETAPSFSWEDHYQYNMLQGLGYRGWPNPNLEPPYWMELILRSLKDKKLVLNFTALRRTSPRLSVNLDALKKPTVQ